MSDSVATPFPSRGEYKLKLNPARGSERFSGWRFIKRLGFHELKYRKRSGKLSFRYLKGPFKISRTDLTKQDSVSAM